MTRRQSAVHGFVLVDKPVGLSSHDVVAQLRRRLNTKVGHAGTLDPFATGLLIVLLGDGTRLMQWVVGHDKRYDALVRLGGRSSTDDRTGELTMTSAPMPPDHRLWNAVAQVEAMTEQVPPGISALHVDGERAYRRVRRGEVVDLPPRPVRFHAIRTIDYSPSRGTVQLDVRCSTGTYVRSVARDLGELLGTGAYLSELRRTEVGPWSVDDAVHPDDVAEVDVRPLADLLIDRPNLRLPNRLVRAVVDGRTVVVPRHSVSGQVEIGAAVGCVDLNDQLVGVCEVCEVDEDALVPPVVGDGVVIGDDRSWALRPRTILSSVREQLAVEGIRP